MAVYRIILMKKPNIAMNLQSQREITNGLTVLEWLTLLFIHGIHLFGTSLNGTGPMMAFCNGNSMAMDHIIQRASGSSKWQIKVGHKCTITGLIYLHFFIALELVIYMILFYDAYCHNENLKNGNSLGLSIG